MKKKLERTRGIILTIEGWQKFQDARLDHELRENKGHKFTLEELGARAELTTATLRKILTRDRGVDKRSIVNLFTALDLELNSDDYTSPKPIKTSDNNRSPLKKIDWGEAIDVSAFYGRSSELGTLEKWLLQDSCRLITIVGMGGIGKTALSVKLAEQIKDKYDCVIWRSLQDVPSIQDILANLIQFIGGKQIAEVELPESTNEKISLLVECLRLSRCLIVLDNVESLFCDSSRAGVCDEEYEEYDRLIQRIGASKHQSCLLLTTREKPKQVAILEGESTPVRTLQLNGIKEKEAEKIIKAKGLSVSKAELAKLVTHYGGNVLALKIAATAIRDLFGRNVAEFLRQNTAVFGDIRALLDEQFNRSIAIEEKMMYWLAINREPITLSQLQEDLVGSVSQFELLEGLESLSRRCLIDRAEKSTTIEKDRVCFTLQLVVMEYVTCRLIDKLCQEIENCQLKFFRFHALIKASAKDYIKNTQIRLILKPMIDKLLVIFKGQKNLENQLKKIIVTLQEKFPREPGYTAGNILNLFCQMETDLTGYDFSNLCVWQADLCQACLHDVNFQNADLAKSVFVETFGGVLSVAFSCDGNLLAAGDTKGEIHLRQVSDGKPFLICKGHSNWVTSVAFSSNSNVLASGSTDHTVKVWDISMGQCLHTLQEHKSEVWSVAFSPDGNMLASGSDDHRIRLWDVATGQCLRTFQGHSNWVTSVAFSPDGNILASGSDDHKIKLWDVATGQCLRTFQEHSNGIRSISFSPNGQTLASGSEDYNIKLWDLNTGKCSKTFQGHSNGIYSVAYSPQGNLVASGSYDRTIKLWSTNNSQYLQNFQGNTAQLLSVAYNPDGQTLASASQDCTIRLWDINTAQVLKTFQGHKATIWSVAYSPDGKMLASGSEDRTVMLWDVTTGQALRTFQGHHNQVLSVAYSPDGKMLASGSEDRTVMLWDVTTGQALRTFQGHYDVVFSVAFDPQGKILASGSLDRTVKLWNISTGECFRTLQGHNNWVWSLAFSPDGKLLASVSCDRTLRLWSINNSQCLKTLSVTQMLHAVAFSPDSRTIASSSQDYTIKLWDVITGECFSTLQGHTSRVWSIAFNPDGKTLATGSEDETIRLWNTTTGECLRILKVEKPYERMNIIDIKGLTEATVTTLKVLGAIDSQVISNC